MESIPELDRKAMDALLRWSKAQEEADKARAEYDKLNFILNKRITEDQEKDWESGEGLSYAEARAAEADARYMRSVTENELTTSRTRTE